MRLSVNFLKDYVNVPVDYQTLAEDMTKIGNEYDAAEKLVNATNLVIGEIVECVNHPDSDHLHVCKVNIGEEVLQIVCGAPNAREGIKVIVAKVGAELPEITIKKGNIRGVESCGMMCSLEELGIERKYLKEKDIEGIAELGSDAIVGEDPIKYLALDDEVIDFELTSNRGDLLSILGMAYEVGALYSQKVNDINLKHSEIDENINSSFNVKVETENCSLFLAKKALNVTIKESPEWIKNRLMASGIRPINNVVDISNYVMLETGQPLHFYDADRLGDTLVVRMANEDEKLVTLDNTERTLSKDDIVISTEKEAVGLAGVMGGLSTEIEEDTKNILIESAIFDGIKVRLTSKKILRSEASNRFEKGLDPNRTYMAIERACTLLEEYADAKILSGTVEYKNTELSEKYIDITFTKIREVLGFEIKDEEILNVFERLGFTYKVDGDNINVCVPRRRIDISIKEDLIEEVGRIYGVDNIVGKLPIIPVRPGRVDKTNRELRNKMIDLGFNETLSYTLIPNSEIKKYTNEEFNAIRLLDPMTEEKDTLRYSLIPSLKMTYDYNKARNLKDICIFEIGKSFGEFDGQFKEHYSLAALATGKYFEELGHDIKVDFYIMKGVLEELLNYFGYNNRYTLETSNLPKELHPGKSAAIIINKEVVGYIGRIHPTECKDEVYVFELNLEKLLSNRTKSMKYTEISKYPSVIKDLAFIVNKNVTAEEIMKLIKKAGGRLLTNIEVFDVYYGENIGLDNKSLAFALTFSDPNRTLTEEEVINTFNKIIKDVESSNIATLRNS